MKSLNLSKTTLYIWMVLNESISHFAYIDLNNIRMIFFFNQIMNKTTFHFC